MNTGATVVRMMLLGVASAVLVVGHAHAGTSCHNINAKGIGQDTGGAGTPQDPATTVAQIRGGGLLQGTTAARFVFTGGTPPVFTFAGPLTFTTNRATLTVSLMGTVDVTSGVFMANGPVVDATGKLAGATGSLILDGVQSFVDGTFVETVTGQICVDLSP